MHSKDHDERLSSPGCKEPGKNDDDVDRDRDDNDADGDHDAREKAMMTVTMLMYIMWILITCLVTLFYDDAEGGRAIEDVDEDDDNGAGV